MTTKITQANTDFSVTEWQSVKTSDFTAVAGEGYFVNTTSAAVEVTLPTSPSAGDVVVLKDYARTWGTNNVTLASALFDGGTSSQTFSTNGQTVTIVYMDGTKGWSLINDDTTSNLGPEYVAATGGTVTESGDYKIHTFTGDGCFVVSDDGNAAGSNELEYIVVAGGGGGASGGGAGAGGFRFATPSLNPGTFPAKPLNAPSALSAAIQTYPITVGAGGAAAPDPCGTDHGSPGSNSSFSTITSAGGAGGAGRCTPGCSLSGGSGGGAASAGAGDASGGAGNTPPTSPPQGSNGGNNSTSPEPSLYYGGGGGAIAVGGNGGGPLNKGGCGGAGAGVPNGFGSSGENCGSYYYFAGGGGGGKNGPIEPTGVGGIGGGGNGQLNGIGGGPNPPSSGTANTGGGGGGGGQACSPNGGQGAGGKGIVIIRYKFQ